MNINDHVPNDFWETTSSDGRWVPPRWRSQTARRTPSRVRWMLGCKLRLVWSFGLWKKLNKCPKSHKNWWKIPFQSAFVQTSVELKLWDFANHQDFWMPGDVPTDCGVQDTSRMHRNSRTGSMGSQGFNIFNIQNDCWGLSQLVTPGASNSWPAQYWWTFLLTGWCLHGDSPEFLHPKLFPTRLTWDKGHFSEARLQTWQFRKKTLGVSPLEFPPSSNAQSHRGSRSRQDLVPVYWELCWDLWPPRAAAPGRLLLQDTAHKSWLADP